MSEFAFFSATDAAIRGSRECRLRDGTPASYTIRCPDKEGIGYPFSDKVRVGEFGEDLGSYQDPLIRPSYWLESPEKLAARQKGKSVGGKP